MAWRCALAPMLLPPELLAVSPIAGAQQQLVARIGVNRDVLVTLQGSAGALRRDARRVQYRRLRPVRFVAAAGGLASSVAQLQAAFANLQSGQTVVINPGTYNLTGTLYVNGRANVTVRGATNNRNDVVLVGQGMGVPSGAVPFGIWTGQGATNVTIANLTIRDIYQHPIVINPGTTNPRIYNVRLVNAGQQFIKANPDGNGVGTANGIVEYSVMEYDTTAVDDYTNGVDVHGGANWIIRHNLFRRIKAPSGQLAGPAILMWRGSSGTIVEGNTFIDCHRDIALGFEDGTSHTGGIIRNNFIYRSGNGGGDVAIGVFGSANTKIVHNTIMMNNEYPSSIETRWNTATGIAIVNNLSDKGPSARDGSQFSQQGNVWTATAGLFVNSVPGDLHLLATAGAAIDRAVMTNDAPLDWDGQARAGTWDVGADEYFAAGAPPPPPPPSEICGNGIDDDGDGQVDEGCPQSPPPPPPPPTEVCGDGLDNDGDGQIDEGCAPPPAPVPAAPGAPSRLMGRVSGSTVALSWLAPIVGSSPTNYIIEAGTAPGQTGASVPVSDRAVTVPGAPPGRYYVRVKAQNAAGTSAASNEVVVSVGCRGASSNPQSLASATSGQLVSLKWVDPDGCSGSRYLLGVGSSPGAADLAIVPLDAANVTVGAPAAVYYARVATQSDFGISAPSNEVQIVVHSADCQPPAFGINLGASVVGRTVALAWSPTSTAAALASDAIAPLEYAIEIGPSAGGTALTFPLGRTTSVALPGPPGDYYVRVRAFNVCGGGPASADQRLSVR
jgi:hypothetical protein